MTKQKKNQTAKKPIFKRWWFWLIVVLVVVAAAPGSNNENEAIPPSQNSSDVIDDTETVQPIEDQNSGSDLVENIDTPNVIEPPKPQLDTAVDQNDESAPPAQQEPPTTQKPLVGTDLFETVYVPYAQKEKPFIFNGVKTFAENCGYEFEITEPTEEAIGEIKIKNDDDYVYIAFLPNSDNLELISIVSYFHTASNSEVSLSNYSTNREAQYDQLTTHVLGESNVNVDSVDAQREFLFS